MTESHREVNALGTIRWRCPHTGFLHRTDGPAVEWADGDKCWYVNGKRHRIDGPAFERPDGAKSWYVNGKRHRIDGPAIEKPDGAKSWYVNGKRHRIDGPAIERANGTIEWWVNGEYLTDKDDGRIVEVDGRQYKLKLNKEET